MSKVRHKKYEPDMVTQRRRSRGFLCAPAAILLLNLLQPVWPDKPNIVILFGDNLAYNDVSIFGAATSKTPNIDRIGLEGLKLNNWNSAAHLCSASRAALLTGKYPVRMGVYPGVFRPDAVYGMMPSETTIAEYLKREGYATSCVGKWHLGHRDEFLPINQGFDEWVGIPYHMSGGSIDNHTCNSDVNETMWLPLYEGKDIIEQPVRVQDLAARYATAASNFIAHRKTTDEPFLLYMAFSHVHQLCAPRDFPEQSHCQWARGGGPQQQRQATFVDAVEEMDWIVGKILQTLDDTGVTNNTLVIFTSDNGPWVAEQTCSGSKGPFEGRWLEENVDPSCTACPHDYVPDPTPEQPRRCILRNSTPHLTLNGVHCGADTGLGSTWEANLRMPALVRWPGHIAASTETMQMVSTLDVLPTVLSIVGKKIPNDVDGKDITNVLTGKDSTRDDDDEERVLYFWRDGFRDGPLPPPYGRMDVAAAKLGRFKAWFWTKSAHYNLDEEVHHDPPLLFDVLADPAEAFPLNTEDYQDIIDQIVMLVAQHKKSIGWTYPWALATDPKYIPCYDPSTGCRTTPEVSQDTH